MKKLFFLAGFVALALQTCFAQTNVSGAIYASTTWTKTNSPYIVTDTVVVFPGVTLTIQPGVTVKFADNKILEIRQATLNAIGNATDSIVFTSNSLSPVPGIWGAVYMNGNLNSTFSYCGFYYGNEAIGKSDLESLDTIYIRNSTFINNITGFYGGWEDCYSIYNSRFIDNVNGIIAYSPYNIINSCTAFRNNVGIIALQRTSIKNCLIDSNGIGLYAIMYDSVINCQINNNNLGLVDSGEYSDNLITKNIIEDNTIGIRLSNSTGEIYCNKICGNSTYDVQYVTLNADAAMSNNYWCTTDSATIASHIYDGYNNIHLGLVTFMPIDTSKCYLTGCNLSLSASTVAATCDTCHNGSATVLITNGSAPYTITWFSSPIQTTPTATNLSPGTYSVCVIDANGCSACYGGVHIDSTNCGHLAISVGSNNATCSTCSDGTAWATVSGGTSPYHYTWYSNPFQSTDTATNLLHGSYPICVSDKYGCSVCDSVTVGTGNCSAHFNLYPDSAVQHHYFATNMASGAAPIHFLWSWGDGSTDTIPFPKHTYASAGYYTICLSITDGVGCTDKYCVSYYLMRMDGDDGILSVDVVSGLATGIQNLNGSNSFSVYPNPASGKLNVALNGNAGKTSITVYNVIGVEEISQTVTRTTATLDISNLASGIYIVEALSGNNISRQRFVKK